MAIEKDSQIFFRKYIRFGKYMIYAAWLGHFAFFMIFLSLDIFPLVVVNIISISIYIVCFYLLKSSLERNEFSLIGWLAYIELIGHALLASYYVGIHSGFHYYIVILAILPFLTFSDSAVISAVKVILIILLYTFIDGTMYDYSPPYVIEESISSSLRLFNVSIFITSAVLISLFYAKINFDIRKQLENASTTDQLTGLYNRRLFIHLAELEINKSKRHLSPLSLVMLDIDDFKRINDEYGHNCGDDLLKNIAMTLHETVRPDDIVSRWGGEEFIVLLPNTDLSHAQIVAERIRERIASQTVNCAKKELAVTVTSGITSTNNPDKSLQKLTELADRAMYIGKANGKNQCVSIEH